MIARIQTVAYDAQALDGGVCGERGVETAPTRCGALSALLSDPEVRKQVGSAWPLYMMLVIGWGGSVTGTREEIGERLGEPGRNVTNWVTALEAHGIVTVGKAGRGMTVELTDQHMSVAMMTDAVAASREAPGQPALDSRQIGVLRLMEQAESVGGKVEIRIAVGGS